MAMKTVKIDDADFERAERLAERRGISVAELFHAFLAVAGTDETPEAYQARMRLVELALNSRHGMKGKWNREEAYAERLSRYEHFGLRGDREGDRPGEVENGGGDHEGR
jgi:hypothetical protein